MITGFGNENNRSIALHIVRHINNVPPLSFRGLHGPFVSGIAMTNHFIMESSPHEIFLRQKMPAGRSGSH